MAEPDLRAEVLAGLERTKQRADELGILSIPLETALRHLREIAERHDKGEGICEYCQTPWPCLTLRDLAPDYAPQALKKENQK